jgi:hypothetical protein
MLDAFVVLVWLGIGDVVSVLLPYRPISLRERWAARRSWPRWAACLTVPYLLFTLGVAGYLHWPVRVFALDAYGPERTHLLAWSFTYMCWGLVVWAAGVGFASRYARVARPRLERALRREH